jgi:hypothetical protein
MPRYVLALATFLCSWAILAFTASGIPVVWDETEYLFRAQLVRDWFQLGYHNLPREALQNHWLFINYAEGHPAGFIFPIVFGQWIASPFVDSLTAARLGPITLFSLACAAIAVHLRERCGLVAAIVAPATLLTFPRIFSEAHFATQDGQLTAWWLLLWVTQSSLPSTNSGTTLGVVLGLTTATKFTGWLAWVPVVLSEVIHRKFGAFRRLLVILPVALLVFYAVNPPLWLGPLTGLREHFERSLNRANTINISTVFLGHMYDVESPLPWYNTLVWLLFVTPVPTLALGAVGLWHGLTRPNAWSITLFLHWIVLMIVRALPGSPPHDGIRLFLPAFGFWCVYAGIGAQRTFTAIDRIPTAYWRLALQSALIVSLLASAANLVRYYPQTLSHYNLIAGGLRGAAAKGMEPAYWWDGLDDDVLRWLNEQTTPGEVIAFSPVFNVAPLYEWNRLRPKTVDPQTHRFQWYVLQNRPGLFSRLDRTLIRREKPAFVKYAGRRPAGQATPADLDVPLISIFSFEQYQRARRR